MIQFLPSNSSQWKALLNTTDIDPNLVGHDPNSTIHTPANKALLNTTDIEPNLVGHDPDSTIQTPANGRLFSTP